MRQVPLFLYVSNHILHPAFQCLTEGIQRPGADGHTVLDAVQGICAEALLVDQIVFCDPFLEEGVVKRLVANHINHRIQFIMLNGLNMPNKLSITEKIAKQTGKIRKKVEINRKNEGKSK